MKDLFSNMSNIFGLAAIVSITSTGFKIANDTFKLKY